MHVELTNIPYRYRFNGASLLIAKANRLAGVNATERSPKEIEALKVAVALYTMAITLLKPFDPNYATVLNWKCLALLRLGQFEDAVRGYEEIIRLSDLMDGKAPRNATALLAEEQIRTYAGRKNEPLSLGDGRDLTQFDDPPYCTFGLEFCELIQQEKFAKAHPFLSADLGKSLDVAALRAEWRALVGSAAASAIEVTLGEHLTDWPDRQEEEVGWCYFVVSGLDSSEGISLVIGKTPQNTYTITSVEFGRP